MPTPTNNTLGTAGYEQIQAILSGLATYEGREISLPDIDRFSVEQDVVAVASAAVALISESMKSQLDRVQGLSILENLFDALIDQGLVDGASTTANAVLTNAIYELILDNFEQLEGADDETLTNGLLGTLNGLTWYLTDSQNWDTANARRASGDGVWAEDGAAGSIIDLAYLDPETIYARVEEAVGWNNLSNATPVSSSSTLDEVIASLDTALASQSVASFADYFAHAMVGSQLVDPATLYAGIFDLAGYKNQYSLDSNNRVFDLDENGNIEFVQVFGSQKLPAPFDSSYSSAYVAPMWMTSYNPGGQPSLGTYVLAQGQRSSSFIFSPFEDVQYLGSGSLFATGPAYGGSTSPVTMIESLWFAIDADPAFKEYLLDKYDLADPSSASAEFLSLYDHQAAPGPLLNGFKAPYNTEEYMIQPPRLRAMKAVVEAAFQEMSGLGLSTADLVSVAGGSVSGGSVTMDDTRPSDWEVNLAALTDDAIGSMADISAALDMFKDLKTLNSGLGSMTLGGIENQMRSALDGNPVGLDYGNGSVGSALPFLEEFSYRYGSGPDYDAILAHVRNDMGSLQNLSVDTFLSNAKLTRENLSSTTQTLLLDVKNAQANLEGAIELLDSTFEDMKNAMRDMFANW